MPIRVTGPRIPPMNLGAPSRQLDAIPADADSAKLKQLLEQNWGRISDFSQITKSETAWLHALASHPNADAALKSSIHERGSAVPLSDAAVRAGAGDLLAALAPAAAPVTDTTGSTPPPSSVTGAPDSVRPADSTTPAPGGLSILDVRAGATTSTRPVAAAIPADLMGRVIFDPDDPAKGVSLDKARAVTTGGTNFLNKPSDMFSGALTLNLAQMLPDDPRLAPLKAAVDKGFVIRTTANQYQLEPGKVGNRVIFFGDDHAQIKDLIHHPDFKEKGRFIKFMTHWAQTHWEGGPKAAFEGERAVLASTHGGALVATTNPQGENDIGWVDWPTDYGRLENSEYAANLGFFSLDNIEYTKPLPANWDDIKTSMYDTMDTMAALQMCGIPFASGDPRPWNTQYKFNLLELTSAEKMTEYTNLLSAPNDPANVDKLKAYSHYCMEGVWNNCNFASLPINQASVDRGLLSQEALDNFKNMERLFKDAGGLEPGQAKKGWKALEAAGLLKANQLADLTSTGMIDVPFKLSHEDARPYTDYGPKGVPTEGVGKGLTAKPLTLAGLLGGMMQCNFPREEVAAQSSKVLMDAIQNAPDDATRMQIVGGAFGAMQGVAQKLESEMALPIDLGVDPTNPAHLPKVVQLFGQMMASQLQVGVLTNPDVIKQAHQAIQYPAMDGPSKEKVDKLLQGYVRVVADFTLSRPELDKALRTADKRAESTTIGYGPPIDRTGEMMVFVPPQYGWLAYNGAGGASWPGLVPVADAMHESYQAGD